VLQNAGINLDGDVVAYWYAWCKARWMLPWFLQQPSTLRLW